MDTSSISKVLPPASALSSSSLSNLVYIPAAYALGIAPHGYYLVRMMFASSFTWTNVAPRSNWELLKDKVPGEVYQRCLRARASHLNAFEGFPLFAAAVIAGPVAGLPKEDIRSMALQYLGVRALYTLAYIGIRNEAASYLRTGLWGWSIALPIITLVKCARKGDGPPL